jgi:hypothetical protein
MLPNTKTQQWISRPLFLAVIGAWETRLLGLNSHAEWVQKTTLAGANREIFCFDWGEDA